MVSLQRDAGRRGTRAQPAIAPLLPLRGPGAVSARNVGTHALLEGKGTTGTERVVVIGIIIQGGGGGGGGERASPQCPPAVR